MAGREAQRNNQRLEYKFIAEYIRCTNKDIYDEANSFYLMVKANNPRVHDLTKTVEFMERAKPNLYIPRYYYNRKGRKTTPTKQTEQVMYLNIPLMTTPTQSPQPTPAAVVPSQPSADPTPVQLTEEPTQSPQPTPAAVVPSQPSAEPTPVQLTEEPTQSPQPTPAAEEPLQPSAEPTPVQLTEEPTQSPQPTPAAEEPLQSVIAQLTEDPLPPLSEEQYHQLILELNQDPDMMFANFDIPGVNDEDMNPQVWNEIQINTTPMEIA